MLLIFAPLAKPCEPPAALGYLSTAANSYGITASVCDMNIEGIHYLLTKDFKAEDTWGKRAVKNLQNNIKALQAADTYTNADRYKRAVADINKVLELQGSAQNPNLHLTLSNYQDKEKSPLKSKDLLQSAEQYQDNVFFPYFSQRLEALLENDDPSHPVGFSLNYLSQALCTFAMIGYVRSHHPTKKIIVGGGLVTTWLNLPNWSNPFENLVDRFFKGKGEQPLLESLGVTGKVGSFMPDYSSLQKNHYLSPGFVLPYTTSFGCFWKKCSFCPETKEQNRYSHNNPKTSVTELQRLSNIHSPVLIHLLDNSISSTTFKSLATTDIGGPWYGFARLEGPLEELEFCKSLRKAGCVMLKLGLESGSSNILNKMRKGIDLDRAKKVLNNLQLAGIATYVYLLFGTPAEDKESALKTQEFVIKHHKQIDFVNLAIFNLPLSGLESSDISNLEISEFYEGDLSIYTNFKHPQGWDRSEVRRFLDTSFKKTPEIAPIITNDPPYFTSNHAPFLVKHIRK